jgi:hypothetical protein
MGAPLPLEKAPPLALQFWPCGGALARQRRCGWRRGMRRLQNVCAFACTQSRYAPAGSSTWCGEAEARRRQARSGSKRLLHARVGKGVCACFTRSPPPLRPALQTPSFLVFLESARQPSAYPTPCMSAHACADVDACVTQACAMRLNSQQRVVQQQPACRRAAQRQQRLARRLRSGCRRGRARARP